MKTAELVTFPARDSAPFPDGGRRLLVYVVYDPRGDVEEYIPYALAQLREHCDRIVVVVNGNLTAVGRGRLEPVADDILVRENRGFDIWGYKHGLDSVGDAIAEYDEVVLANDTWFGPVQPFEPVFERMDQRPLHFWGMTDHVRVEPHPFTNTGYLPYHLQSYWVAVRRDMFLSEEWRDYWRDLPEMNSYSDAVVKHEGVFTEHFTDRGFVGRGRVPDDHRQGREPRRPLCGAAHRGRMPDAQAAAVLPVAAVPRSPRGDRAVDARHGRAARLPDGADLRRSRPQRRAADAQRRRGDARGAAGGRARRTTPPTRCASW